MPRIPDDEVERLKAEVPIAQLVRGRGVELKRHGADLIGRCPFHNDKTPSLVVSARKNLWHCKGACGVGGSVIDWVMRAEGVDFRTAVERLTAMAPCLAVAKSAPAAAAVKVLDAEDHAALRRYVERCHAKLLATPKARGYLEQRGIGLKRFLEYFEVGFADDTLGAELGGDAALRARMVRLGVLKKDGREHFAGCVVFPLVDAGGAIRSLYGRRVEDVEGLPAHLYLPGLERGLFNPDGFGLSATKTLILAEAVIDAATWWVAGYLNVTASYGVEGFTAEHLQALKRHQISRVVIAYDADVAGDRGAETLAEKLGAEGIACSRVMFPRGLDANAFALKIDAPVEGAFGVLLEMARPMGPGRGETSSPFAAEPTAAVALAAVSPPRVVKKRPSSGEHSPLSLEAEGAALVEEVAGFYHETLKVTPRALEALSKMGLDAPELIARFRLGYSDQSLNHLVPNKDRKDGAALRRRLLDLGVLMKDGRERMLSALVVPITDEAGRVIGMVGHRILPQAKGVSPEVELPALRRGMFQPEAFRSKSVILAGSVWEALAWWAAGYPNVTASPSGDGSKELLEAVKAHGTAEVLIATAADAAGDAAAEGLAKKLVAAGVGAYRVEFPKGMGASAYVQVLRPANKSLGLVLKKARWMGAEPAPPHPYATLELALAEGVNLPMPAPIIDPALVRAPEPIVEAAPEVLAPIPPEPNAPAPEVALAREPTPPFAAEESSTVAPAVNLPAEVSAEEVVLRIADRRYRVRGLAKNLSYDLLKVNLLVARGERYFVDTLDLYSARQRVAYVKQAAVELGVEEDMVKSDVGRVLLKLESLQDQQIQGALAPKDAAPTMTPAEEEEAMTLLKDPRLVERILEDFEACGVVGEETNKLMGYVAAVSRKLSEPLAVIIQSSSAAGKTSLMEGILAMVPEEDRVKFSAITGQSLFYMGETNLRHKVLALVEEEGAERASYALKLLQSERELTIASTGKDPATGRLVTHEYRVEGPVMIVLTTTAVTIDEELLNRAVVLTVNEERAQTQAIHRLQRSRETLSGLLGRAKRGARLTVHQNAQRLLKPIGVVNPFAEQLTFIDSQTRTRRDHMKYLVLIRAIALLHQHQRPVKTAAEDGVQVEYIEVERSDIALANRLAHQVLGRSLDELSPQTRQLLLLLDRKVGEQAKADGTERAAVRFSRRTIREWAAWSYNQVRVHLEQLIELEYLLVHGGGRGQQHSYELVYDGKGQGGEPFLVGLTDVEALRSEKCVGTLSPPCPPFVPRLVSQKRTDKQNDSPSLAAEVVETRASTVRAPLNGARKLGPIG